MKYSPATCFLSNESKGLVHMYVPSFCEVPDTTPKQLLSCIPPNQPPFSYSSKISRLTVADTPAIPAPGRLRKDDCEFEPWVGSVGEKFFLFYS